jgi:hypothetical protein
VVVAAVDPSQTETQITGINDRIIQAANGLSMQCSAELHLLHAYDRKGLGKWVGSTTEHVLYQVPCNIFAVTGSADQ